MKHQLKTAFLFAIAFLALAALLGLPTIPPEVLAGLGVIPFAMTGEISTSDISDMLKKQSEGLEEWKKKHSADLAALEASVFDIAKKAGRPDALDLNNNSAAAVKQLITADGRKVPFLRSEQKFSNLYRGEKSDFNIGDFCRDAVCGSTKAASGAALVPVALGSQIIDMVREATVISLAGAGTIAIDGPTNLAKLTSGPTVYQHTEGAADISESDIVAVPVALNPKTLAVLIPLTVELVQDSPNLDALLSMALGGAFASKLDALCLATLLADANIPKSLATQDPALWAKLLEAVGSALALNQRLPTAHISAPADFIGRAGQLASTAGTWLGKPPALVGMAEHQTTGLTAGTALFGSFAEAFAIAMRSELRVEVVRHASPTKGTHLLVAHMRADGIVLQPGKLFKQLKTVA